MRRGNPLRHVGLAGLVTAALAAPAAALPLQDTGDVRVESPGRPPVGRAPDGELAETIERVMVEQFRRRLELTESQELQVAPLYRSLTQARRGHVRERREALRTLTAMSQDSRVAEGDLLRRLELFEQDEERFRRRERDLVGSINAELEPRQRARLLVFEDRFREEMRRRMNSARHPSGPGPDGRRGKMPGDAAPPGPGGMRRP